jgi:predicted enzyme related to lactoylglutathione lyase
MDFDSAILYTNNLEKAIDFYQGIIGLEVEYRQNDEYISFLFPNGARIGIKAAIEKREKPGFQTIIISLNNIKDFYQKIKDNNVNIYEELKTESWGTTFSILDVDNNRIEFLKRD